MQQRAQRLLTALIDNPQHVKDVLKGIEEADKKYREVLGDQPVLSIHDAIEAYKTGKLTSEQFNAHLIVGANNAARQRFSR